MDDVSRMGRVSNASAESTAENPADARERVRRRVMAEARLSFTGLGEAELQVLVDRVLDRIWGDGPRVTTFVPLIAMRYLRSELATSPS